MPPLHIVNKLIIVADGSGLTVTTVVIVALPQLPLTEYDMVAVPDAMPVTIPVDATVAIPVADELHAPLLVASVKLVVVPMHIVPTPVIVPAPVGLTVTASVALTEQP